MRAFLIVLLISVSLISFTSCQKEISGEASSGSNDTTGNNSPVYLVKTYTEDVTTASGQIVVTFNLTYDANSRIKSLVSTTNPGDKFVYQYNANSTYTMDLFNSNVLSIRGIFFINSMQLVDSMLQYNDTGDTSTEKYIYNSAKQIVKKKEYEIVSGTVTLVNTTDLLYDASGNVIKETSSNGVTTYEYYTDLLNNLNVGLVYYSQNKNLPKKTIVAGAPSGTISHTYTFDSLNRLTSEKAVTNNGDVLIKTFTY